METASTANRRDTYRGPPPDFHTAIGVMRAELQTLAGNRDLGREGRLQPSGEVQGHAPLLWLEGGYGVVIRHDLEGNFSLEEERVINLAGKGIRILAMASPDQLIDDPDSVWSRSSINTIGCVCSVFEVNFGLRFRGFALVRIEDVSRSLPKAD